MDKNSNKTKYLTIVRVKDNKDYQIYEIANKESCMLIPVILYRIGENDYAGKVEKRNVRLFKHSDKALFWNLRIDGASDGYLYVEAKEAIKHAVIRILNENREMVKEKKKRKIMKSLGIAGLILLGLILWGLIFANCVEARGFLVNGVKIEKETFWKDLAMISLGAMSSAGMHWLGHVVYFEATGTRWKQFGVGERFESKGNDHAAWAGRSGFLLQTSIGTGIVYYGRNSNNKNLRNFISGYTGHNFISCGSYPAVFKGKGDFKEINLAGNGNLEYLGFTAWSGRNFIKSLDIKERK